MRKYDYTIHKDNSPKVFKEGCEKVAKFLPKATRKKLLVYVDGSTIQVFEQEGQEVVLYDDYDVGAVYVSSDINLNKIFSM